MKVHVLLENTSACPQLRTEHGLSLLIECAGKRILFDTGATSTFAENASLLGLHLDSVDAAVISHGHYDHGGGIQRFLQLNSHASVWVSPHAFRPHFNASGKDIGLPAELEAHERICVGSKPIHELYEGISLHSAAPLPCTYPAEGAGMKAIIDGHRVADDFRHEQYLLLREGPQRILISGCSHRGILNIAHYFRPDVLIGGFHFMKVDVATDAPRLNRAADLLLELPTRYYTGHCTGEAAFRLLKTRMGERLQAFRTGDVLNI